MSDTTRQWYNEWKANLSSFAEIYNKDTNEGIKHLCHGTDEQQAAWRYSKIHGAVMLMGGMANFEYWVNRHAEEYFCLAEKLDGENMRLKQRVKQLERKIMRRERKEIRRVKE